MDKLKKQELHLIFNEIRQGNTNKLNALYENYNKLIYGIAFSVLKNKEDSEDIVQIVFMKIFQIDKNKLPTINEASWLYSLTKNETINYLRKKKQEINLDEIYYISEEDKELNKIIDNDSYNRLIAKLDKQGQEIISLKILSNMSFREISLLLNIPMGTVQWKYYTSLYTLRLLLGNISMVIIGILLFIKSNISSTRNQETNMSNDISMDSETEEAEQSESEMTSSVDNVSNSSEMTDAIIQNEIIEVEDPQTNQQGTNSNIGILSFTGIFLFFTIIFTIIFVKHQQKAHKNVSK
mgnify:CR=1 FL=1